MVSLQATRRKVLITGAAGGVGKACARTMGGTHDLILTDREQAPLLAFAEELGREGYAVAATAAGDLADDALLGRLANEVAGSPFTLLHCAGLSPSLADWRAIMSVNLVATEKLLRTLEPGLSPGSVAILVSSAAGYRIVPSTEEKAAIVDPLAKGFLDRLEEMLAARAGEMAGGMAGVSYSLSKYAVHRICERRAMLWGRKGARILSVSPTLMLTAMGQSEVAATPGAENFLTSAPMGRTCRAIDVAQAIEFLAGDKADFITGCDIRVDGGSVAATVLAPQRP